MNGRKYAEDLIGNLNRDIYENQRQLAEKSYKTDWEDLQNQYKNLQETLKRKQEESNLAFNKGLVNVAENSYDRMRNINTNLANRGLTTSGIRDLATQSDIAQKGSDVLGLLGTSGDMSINIASKLASGTKDIADQARDMGYNLSDTLGDIGQRDAQAQMDYNNALAAISEGKVARDEANELSARQRAASRSGGGSNKYDDELEEFYKRMAISEILTSPVMSDDDKARSLMVHFGMDNTADVINAYNKNILATDTYNEGYNRLNEETAALQNRMDNLRNSLNKANNNIQQPSNFPTESYYKGPNVGLDSIYYSIPDASRNNSYVKNNVKNNYSNILDSVISDYENKNKELSKYVSQGITYQDLANLLYGNR